MRATRTITIGALLLMTGAACARANVGAPGAGSVEGPLALQQGPDAPSAAVKIPSLRQLLRVGHMKVQMRDPRAGAARLEAHVAAIGGYVESSRGEGDGSSADLQLRVPSTLLDATMNEVGTLGEVRERSVNAQDITDQLVDLDARRATLAASRDRLRELLQRAEGIRAVVEMEHELTRVQSQLDSMDRQLESMRGRVALSHLSVRLEREKVLGPIALLAYGVGKVVRKLFVWRE